MEMKMAIRELNNIEIEAVDGGVRNAVIGWAVGKILDAAVDFFNKNASGGADETTWTNIGNSQMTA